MISATTPGLGGLGDIGDWWTEPIVFQKVAVWTLLWEILGLGSGSMPLTARYGPSIGGVLYWLRPGHGAPAAVAGQGAADARLRRARRSTSRSTPACSPPASTCCVSSGRRWPGRRRAARPGGDRACCSAAGRCSACATRSRSSPARPEVYGFLLLVSLFPIAQPDRRLAVRASSSSGGAPRRPSSTATSRSCRGDGQQHAVEPLAPGQGASSTGNYPDDLRPGRPAAIGAHLGTAVEFALPLVLIVSRGGTIGTIAVIGMIIFHIHITSTFPLGVPLEWNLFMIFGLLFLFGHYGDVPLSTLDDPLLIALLVIGRGGHPGRSATCARRRSRSCPACATTRATGRPACGCSARTPAPRPSSTSASTSPRRVTVEQLAKLYGPRDAPSYFLEQGAGLPRDAHPRPRAERRCCRAGRRRRRRLLPCATGEIVAGVVVGWNFGDGHFHNQQLLDGRAGAVRLRADGELRDRSSLEGQPAHIAAPALPDLRRRDGPGRGGLRRRRRDGRAPARGWRSRDFPVEVTRTGAGRQPRRRSERGDRRRLRPERAGRARSRSPAQGVEVTVLEAERDDRRRRPQRRADAARAAARRLLGRPPDGASARRPCARSAWSGTGSSGAGPRSTAPTRSTTAAPA